MARNDLTGSLFADRYRLERKLGSGGMADVWLAEDQELGRRVAVKILHERYANDEQFVERFRREATHAAGLSHPNIVSIYDRGVAEGSYYIVMEYIEGRTLKELIVTRGPCPVQVAISYTRQILAALRYAHKNGIIHRDIKPHNVIVDREGRVKVADFGIARAGASEMTEAGSIVGTAQYLSPEQARGAPVDESSDLYSTGIVLYELLTGTVPFTGETPVEIAMKHLSQTPEAPSARRAEIPHDLDLVVLRALAKEPADRYRSAADLDRDLELVARGDPVGTETETAATMVLAGAGRDRRHRRHTRHGPPRPCHRRDVRRRGALPGVRRARSTTAKHLAVAAGRRGPDRRRGRGLVPLRQRAEADRQQQAARRPAVHGHRREPRRQPDPRRRFRAEGPQAPERRAACRDRVRAVPVEGTGLARGGIVTILVSTGKKNVNVPDVVGDQLTDAVATLTRAGLTAKSVGVPSDEPSGTVTGQDPRSGTSLVEGATVRINYSTGPKQIAVPPVVGLDYSTALQQLQAAGFAVRRTDVESDQAAGIVVSQVPTGSSTATKGSTVTLSVSNGPQTTPLPDVSGQTEADAKATLTAAGFKVTVTPQDTDVETFDGVVISQDPPGNTQQDPKTIVTLFVGVYVPPARRRRPDRHDDHDPVSTPLRVAVLAGGRSSEHEISLASARSVVEALDPDRYETRMIEIGRDGALGAAAGTGKPPPSRARTGRCRSRPPRLRPPSARSMSCSPSSTGPSARTAPSRGSSSSPVSRTSAPAWPRPRSAWTRTSSRRFSGTAASPSHRTSRSGPGTRSRTPSAIPCS